MDSKPVHSLVNRERLLTIGAFSAATCLSIKALRLYDRHGLLKPAYTDPENGYRYYSSGQLRTAQKIRLMRQMDIPLARIRRMLTITVAETANMAETHTREMEERAQRARGTLNDLLRCLYCEAQEGTTMSETKMHVETRELPPQLILSISRRTKIDGLEAHVQESPKRLQAMALTAGAEIAGGAFGIFHGPVNSENDGPMEVCLPVKGAVTPSGDVVLRELPGGSVVMVSGSGEYCDFPKVLELYDAAAHWIEQNGFAMAESPREWWQGPNGEPDQMTVVWPYRYK